MKKVLTLITTTLLAVTLLAGCNQAVTKSPSSTKAPAVKASKLSVVGSTSVGPLMEEIAKKYEAKYEGAKVEIQQLGSGAGIKNATDGTADIGMSSRELTPAEIADGLKPIEIALDGIAVVVNPKNNVKEITLENAKKIFEGQITNWKELGGKDAKITIVSREDGSGTRGAFEELVKLQKEVEKDGKKVKVSTLDPKAQIASANGDVKTNVSTNENAIGYLSLGMLDSQISALKVNGVDCTTENIINKTYKISRPFLLLTKGEPKGDAKQLIDFVLSKEGQEMVVKGGYIAVPEKK